MSSGKKLGITTFLLYFLYNRLLEILCYNTIDIMYTLCYNYNSNCQQQNGGTFMRYFIDLPSLSDKELEELSDSIEEGTLVDAILKEKARRERVESSDS